MNPLFNQLMGSGAVPQVQAGIYSPAVQNANTGPLNGILARAQQIAQAVRNPKQLVAQFLPGIPADMTGSPEKIIEWLQRTGRVTPEMMSAARQMMG